MNNRQNGFTLIELMIAMAIVGILAIFAVPAYQDYVIRTKITDPFVTVSGAKAAIYEHFSSEGEMPDASSALANDVKLALLRLPAVQTALSSSPSTNKNSLKLGFTVTNMGGSTGNSAKNTLYFEFKGLPDGVSINCSSVIGTTIDSNYLPTACR